MVDISVRVIEHSQTEYQMSHKLWFAPATGVDARRDRPNLFIVPRTKPSDQAGIGALVDDLLKALDATRARQLQFTHFGFTNRVKNA